MLIHVIIMNFSALFMCDWAKETYMKTENLSQLFAMPQWIDMMPEPRVIKTHQMLGTLHPDLLNTCKVNTTAIV